MSLKSEGASRARKWFRATEGAEFAKLPVMLSSPDPFGREECATRSSHNMVPLAGSGHQPKRVQEAPHRSRRPAGTSSADPYSSQANQAPLPLHGSGCQQQVFDGLLLTWLHLEQLANAQSLLDVQEKCGQTAVKLILAEVHNLLRWSAANSEDAPASPREESIGMLYGALPREFFVAIEIARRRVLTQLGHAEAIRLLATKIDPAWTERDNN